MGMRIIYSVSFIRHYFKVKDALVFSIVAIVWNLGAVIDDSVGYPRWRFKPLQL